MIWDKTITRHPYYTDSKNSQNNLSPRKPKKIQKIQKKSLRNPRIITEKSKKNHHMATTLSKCPPLCQPICRPSYPHPCRLAPCRPPNQPPHHPPCRLTGPPPCRPQRHFTHTTNDGVPWNEIRDCRWNVTIARQSNSRTTVNAHRPTQCHLQEPPGVATKESRSTQSWEGYAIPILRLCNCAMPPLHTAHCTAIPPLHTAHYTAQPHGRSRLAHWEKFVQATGENYL